MVEENGRGGAVRSRPVFVTGASGYVGGRLVPRLLEAGYTVRCLARSPRKLTERPWGRDGRVQVCQGDLSEVAALVEAMRGCGAAYYLVHSMVSAGASQAARDREMATRFAQAAERAGLARIIYLGGLAEIGARPGEGLAARQEVERALLAHATPVTTLRFAMIIGSGSGSFEILRGLARGLPIMVAPRWMSTACQPIAVRNVLEYLVACLSTLATEGRSLDIGGPDVLSYRELIRVMAEELGRRPPLALPVPVGAARASALWIHLLTPIGRRAALPLVTGLRHDVVCRSDEAHRLLPLELLPVREAIRLALTRIEERNVQTVWSSAGPIPGAPDWSDGAVHMNRRTVDLDVVAPDVFRAVCRLGGANGWYAANRLWWLRGLVDRLVGGPGLHRGRRDPERLSYGEAVDFWRVVALEQDRRLALRAEMRLPGEAELEFAIEPLAAAGAPPPRSRLTLTARFRPRGLAGHAYWYALVPLHGIVFRRMIQGISRAAARLAAAREGPPPCPDDA